MMQPEDRRSRNRERLILFILAAIQFTSVLDFLIMMPLGPQYMRVFAISPGQFGFMVSAYALSAGIAGIVAGIFLDRFDRKTALLALFAGFAAGTLLCALADSYHLLTAARVVAGGFGGVCGATILAIIADVIPEHRRATAMGLVMSAFSLASIIGVPLGLELANRFSWHAPFFLLTGLCVPIGLGAWRLLPPMIGHLHHSRGQEPVAQMRALLCHPNHLRAFILMFLVTSAGFFVIPFISPYMVKNVGLTERQLPYIYLFGGLFTIFSMNLIGRLADRYGKKKLYNIMVLISLVPTIAVTNLPASSLATAVSVTTFLWIAQSGRFVPAMAIIVGSVQQQYRGGFMSLNSAVQQFASGAATFASGLIIGQTAAGGALTRFGVVGGLSAFLAVLGIFFARRVQPAETPDKDLPVPLVPGCD